MKKFAVVLVTSLALLSCAEEVEKTMSEVSQTDPSLTDFYEEIGEGFQVMESSCISCHHPNPNTENKIAPSFTEIKISYLKQGKDMETFTQLFTQFVANPSAENAVVEGAIEKYGVMPKFDISEREAKQLATYLFHSPVEKPDWYTKYYSLDQENFKASDTLLNYVDLGKKYALSTKAVLGKNLKGAIKSKGTLGAVSFCNSKAYPLTDSMSVVLNAQIKRVSDQPRNPNNNANELELAYIHSSKEMLAKGDKLKPQMQEMNGKMVGYYPITTNAMCLQCHGGLKTQIKPEVGKKLQDLYPNDLATGYGENELRGIWVVTMDKSN